MTKVFSTPPAVILAAGEGTRLQSNGVPKALTMLCGLSFVERAILTCCQAGLSEFYVVVGYRQEEIIPCIKTVGRHYNLKIQVVENPVWEAGNGTSAAACAPYLSGPFFLMMCDHFFDPQILHTLLAADDGSDVCRLAVDRRLEDIFDIDDATKVRLDQDTVTAIGKTLQTPDASDTGFFLCRPALFQALAQARQQGKGSLSAGIRQLIKSAQIRAVDVSGLFWHDVDTPEALAAGRDHLLRNGADKLSERIQLLNEIKC